jgi:hypothetical protein
MQSGQAMSDKERTILTNENGPWSSWSPASSNLFQEGLSLEGQSELIQAYHDSRLPEQ